MQGRWNDTDSGQTVTIKCEKKHVLDGSSERTCKDDGMWDDEAPLCRKLSKYEHSREWEVAGRFLTLRMGVLGTKSLGNFLSDS